MLYLYYLRDLYYNNKCLYFLLIRLLFRCQGTWGFFFVAFLKSLRYHNFFLKFPDLYQELSWNYKWFMTGHFLGSKLKQYSCRLASLIFCESLLLQTHQILSAVLHSKAQRNIFKSNGGQLQRCRQLPPPPPHTEFGVS